MIDDMVWNKHIGRYDLVACNEHLSLRVYEEGSGYDFPTWDFILEIFRFFVF